MHSYVSIYSYMHAHVWYVYLSVHMRTCALKHVHVKYVCKHLLVLLHINISLYAVCYVYISLGNVACQVLFARPVYCTTWADWNLLLKFKTTEFIIQINPYLVGFFYEVNYIYKHRLSIITACVIISYKYCNYFFFKY